jgi:uncharacterized protein YgiM (DUF1202 family)
MWEEGEFTRSQMELTERNNRQAAEDRRQEAENRNRNSGGQSSSDASANGLGILILLGIGGFVLYKIYMFIKANWVSIVTILGICVACVIVCIIIHVKARKTGLKTLFTILASIGLICAVLFFGPAKMVDSFSQLRQKITFQKKPTTTPVTATIYAYVITDALNVRAGPSVDSEIVGRLTKDERVEIVDNSEQWRKIKSENIEGYVDSDYLRYE